MYLIINLFNPSLYLPIHSLLGWLIDGAEYPIHFIKYMGNVHMRLTPICDTNWDDKDAKVLCKTIGFDMTETTAFAYRNTKFLGGKGYQYRSRHYEWRDGGIVTRMTDVDCQGYEDKIWECPHKTLGESYCSPYHLAGVLCYQWSTLELRGGTVETEGEVEVMERHVCYDGWTENSAQVSVQL